MASVNKVILVGNLGRDPEMRYTTTGRAVVNFSLATSERWTGKDGTKQERTEWHNIVLWDKLAEIANQYLKKGSSCYIEGRITNRSWEDNDKAKHYRTEIVGTEMKMLGGRDGGGGGNRNEPPPITPDEYYDSYSEPAGGGGGMPAPAPDAASGGDDLPF